MDDERDSKMLEAGENKNENPILSEMCAQAVTSFVWAKEPSILASMLSSNEITDINCRDSSYGNATCLMMQATDGNRQCAELLLSWGDAPADVNLRSDSGKTALHRASANNHPALVRLLLEHGADRTIREKKGKTPEDRAKKKNNEECISILQAYHPDVSTPEIEKRRVALRLSRVGGGEGGGGSGVGGGGGKEDSSSTSTINYPQLTSMQKKDGDMQVNINGQSNLDDMKSGGGIVPLIRLKHAKSTHDSFSEKVKHFSWANVKIDSNKANRKSIVLGIGSFSDVYKGQLEVGRGDFRDVAIKVYKCQQDIEDDDDESYLKMCEEAIKEADIIANTTGRMLNKSGIVTLYGVVLGTLTPDLSSFFKIQDGQSRVGIVLGHESASLHKVLYPAVGQMKLAMSLEQKISLVKSLADALRNLHYAGCVHGDLKPQNILLSGDINDFHVKLADFNISELRDAQEIASLSKGGTLLQQTKSFRGTKAYCAVEQLPDPKKPNAGVAKASRRTDMFSLAVIIWEIFSGVPPHHELNNNEGALYLKLYNNERPCQPSVDEIPEMPLALRDMVKRCWDKDGSARPTAAECYSLVSHIKNNISEGSFDIFFSHCWVDKEFLSHVYTLLTALGFRVWYDQIDMQFDVDNSMRHGVKQSKAFLCCFNSTYETRPNCLFELEQCTKNHPNKPVITLVMEDLCNASNPWNIKQECKEMLKLGLPRGNNMYCDVHKVANNPAWKDPNTKDCIPSDLIEEMETALQPLVKILFSVGVTPSFAGK